MNNTVAKNRRILNAHGQFENFKEDKEQSQKAYDAAGTSEQEVLGERSRKQISGANMTKDNKEKALAGTISDAAFEAEMKKRGLGIKKAKAPKTTEGTPNLVPVPSTEEKSKKIPSMKKMTVVSIKQALADAGIMYSEDVTDKAGLYEILVNDGRIGADDLGDDDDGL